MSVIKDLKNSNDNTLSIVDAVQLFCPDGKTKYVETLLRIIKKTPNLDEYINEVKENLKSEYGIGPEKYQHLTPFQLFMVYRFIDFTFDSKDLKTYQKFCEYNERGLIVENDLTKYNDITQIEKQVDFADLKVQEKELERQIKVVYNDNEWIVLRPLTLNSSLKYGSSTKWCTAMETNKDYFDKYSKKGILIYMVNKKTALKVACYKAIEGEKEFSFWDAADSRLDSLETGLPSFILESVMKEIKEFSVTNHSLLPQDLKEENKNLNSLKKAIGMDLRSIRPSGSDAIAARAATSPEIIAENHRRFFGNANIENGLEDNGAEDDMEPEQRNVYNSREISEEEVNRARNILNNPEAGTLGSLFSR